MQKVSESIDSLAKSDEPLTQEERRHRETLSVRKLVLDKIKEAKEKQRAKDELYNNVVYSMLKSSLGQKHPFLTSFILRNFRSGMHYHL